MLEWNVPGTMTSPQVPGTMTSDMFKTGRFQEIVFQPPLIVLKLLINKD